LIDLELVIHSFGLILLVNACVFHVSFENKANFILTEIPFNFSIFHVFELLSDAPPNSLVDSIMSLNVKTTEGLGVGACSLARSTLGVEGGAGALRWGLGRVTSKSITHMHLHKPNNKLVSAWLEHFWCMDEPWVNTDS
jgi:hypothetical protein